VATLTSQPWSNNHSSSASNVRESQSSLLSASFSSIPSTQSTSITASDTPHPSEIPTPLLLSSHNRLGLGLGLATQQEDESDLRNASYNLVHALYNVVQTQQSLGIQYQILPKNRPFETLLENCEKGDDDLTHLKRPITTSSSHHHQTAVANPYLEIENVMIQNQKSYKAQGKVKPDDLQDADFESSIAINSVNRNADITIDAEEINQQTQAMKTTNDTQHTHETSFHRDLDKLQRTIQKRKIKGKDKQYAMTLFRSIQSKYPSEEGLLKVYPDLIFFLSIVQEKVAPNVNDLFEVYFAYHELFMSKLQDEKDSNEQHDEQLPEQEDIVHHPSSPIDDPNWRNATNRAISSIARACSKRTKAQDLNKALYSIYDILESLPQSNSDTHDIYARTICSIFAHGSDRISTTKVACKFWSRVWKGHNDVYKKSKMKYGDGDEVKKEESTWISDKNSTVFYYDKVLLYSTFERQRLFDFGRILRLVVERGAKPRPKYVVRIVQNGRPYANFNSMNNILNAVIMLQKSSDSVDYKLYSSVLEEISQTASRYGRSDIILLIWNYLEIMQSSSSSYQKTMKITRDIYENSAIAFAKSSFKEDESVFSTLSTMENQGITPSPIFLHKLSREMTNSVRRLDNALFMLSCSQDSSEYNDDVVQPSALSLNCILASYGHLGLMKKALKTYSMFDELECEANQDTFEFLMMSIMNSATKSISDHRANDEENEDMYYDDKLEGVTDNYLDTAEAVLEASHQISDVQEVHSTTLHCYVKLLCMLCGNRDERIREMIGAFLETHGMETLQPETVNILEDFLIKNTDTST